MHSYIETIVYSLSDKDITRRAAVRAEKTSVAYSWYYSRKREELNELIDNIAYIKSIKTNNE